MRIACVLVVLLPALGCAASKTSGKGPCVTSGAPAYVDVSASGGTTCAVRASGEVDCWGVGYRNERGFRRDGVRSVALGISDAKHVDVGLRGGGVCIERAERDHPVCLGLKGGPIASHVPLAGIASGEYGACALTEGGAVFCWGDNKRGQLGLAKSSHREVTAPTQLVELSGMRQIDLGAQHGCGVDDAGKAWCWGYGQARLGRTARSGPAPQQLQLDGVEHVAAGHEHACAVLQGGSVRCWGRNSRGQLGSVGKSSWLPVEVAAVTNATHVAAGFEHSCALLQGGDVACWGDERTNKKQGVRTIVLSAKAKQIAAGSRHDCALLEDGRIECWGSQRPRLHHSCR